VKIADRALCVQALQPSERQGLWLIPELTESSPRICPWIEKTAGPNGCAPLDHAVRGTLFHRDGRNTPACTCVPVSDPTGNGWIEKIGARGPALVSRSDLRSISTELHGMGREMNIQCNENDMSALSRKETSPRRGRGRWRVRR
jgi:hypothetical protein